MNEPQVKRRTATIGLLAGTVGLGAFPASAAAVPRRRPRLAFKGVAYDVGTGFLGDDSRMRWSRELMRGEVGAIRDRLHANWVSVYGSDVGRLVETASEVLQQGMAVSVQPRAFDEPQGDALAKLREVAIGAERLRRRFGPEVMLVVGCEFMLFTPGIVPGADFFERVAYLAKGDYNMTELQRKFRVFTAQMVKVARRHFHGRITYGAAHDLRTWTGRCSTSWGWTSMELIRRSWRRSGGGGSRSWCWSLGAAPSPGL
ncbi:hypothetical protein, partial [Kribbella albertanoniae]